MADAAFADPALIDCIWLSAAAVAALAFDASVDAALAVAALGAATTWATALPDAAVVVGTMLDNVELIEIS
jgi:hypothetical protein